MLESNWHVWCYFVIANLAVIIFEHLVKTLEKNQKILGYWSAGFLLPGVPPAKLIASPVTKLPLAGGDPGQTLAIH
jgi:hypothetical protein